jgi:hypothetical protein
MTQFGQAICIKTHMSPSVKKETCICCNVRNCDACPCDRLLIQMKEEIIFWFIFELNLLGYIKEAKLSF